MPGHSHTKDTYLFLIGRQLSFSVISNMLYDLGRAITAIIILPVDESYLSTLALSESKNLHIKFWV